MRADIAKVIVERPRYNQRYGGGNDRAANVANDNLPHRESIRAPHRSNRKDFSDYLAPVRRFIEGTVGRRWDDVFSEICEHLGGGSTTQEHVLSHIDGYIAIKVIRCDRSEFKTGLVSHYALTKSGYRAGSRHPVSAGELYVDPDDGIIKRAKNRHVQPKIVKPKTFHHIDGNHVAVLQDGIWYNVTVKPYEVVTTHRMVYDATGFGNERTFTSYRCDGRICDSIPERFVFSQGYLSSSRTIAEFYGRPGVYGASKVQMNSKELRHYGLNNA